jgi:hypothetical protein
VVAVIATAFWCGAASAAPPADPPADPSATVPAPSVNSTPGAVIGPEVPAVEQPPPIVDPNVVSSPLVVVPAGCAATPAPTAVFVGTLAAADSTTGRFAVQEIRAGSLDGYAVNTIVDVRFDDDIRYLHIGEQYLVGVLPDQLTHVLHSKVRSPAPLFGGDAVIGVNDTDVRCPRIEDGVKTLLVDGTEVDTGVLAPLKTAKRSIVKAIVKPLVAGILVLIVLAAMKLLIFAMVRAARERDQDDDGPVPYEVPRDRQHADDDRDALTERV